MSKAPLVRKVHKVSKAPKDLQASIWPVLVSILRVALLRRSTLAPTTKFKALT